MSRELSPAEQPADDDSEAAQLQRLRTIVKRGQLFDAERWGPLLDRVEAVAASEVELPGSWLPVLDKQRKGNRSAKLALVSILTACHRWDGHEDVDTLAKTVPAPFSQAALAEVAGPLAPHQQLPFIDEPFISIDGPEPLEIDDALWAAADGDDIVVSIAIASPADFITSGGALQREVAKRAQTFYHPRHTRLMLPQPLIDASSLTAGQRRPAIVTRVRVAPSGLATLVDVRHGSVQVQAAICYDDIDALLAEETAPAATKTLAAVDEALREAVHALWAAAQRSEARRIERGAWLLYRYATEVSCAPFKSPVIVSANQGSPAHRVVGEAMVLCGAATAQFCGQHNLAVPHRGQARPKQPPLPPGLYTEPADIRSMLRHMSPASTGLVATPHSTLGLDAYVQASSPLRRYLDLLVHQQIIAHLAAKPPPHTATDVQRAIAKCQSTGLKYRRSQRRADQYFTLLHLAQLGIGSHHPAQLVADISRKGRHVAYIEQLCVEVDLPGFGGDHGTRVTVELDTIDVFAGAVRGRVVD